MPARYNSGLTVMLETAISAVLRSLAPVLTAIGVLAVVSKRTQRSSAMAFFGKGSTDLDLLTKRLRAGVKVVESIGGLEIVKTLEFSCSVTVIGPPHAI